MTRIFWALCFFMIGLSPIVSQNWQQKFQIADNLVNSRPDSAYTIFKEIIESSKDSTLIVKSYAGLGTVFQFKSEYDSSITIYFKALDMAEQLGDLNQVNSIKNRLGSLYLGISDLEKAGKYLGDAVAFFETSKDTVSLTQTNMNLAGVFFMSGDIQESIDRLKYCSRLAKASKNYRTEGAIYSNLSMVYQSMDLLDSAILFVNKGIEILGELDDLRGKMLSLKQKALLLESAGRIDEAKSIWTELFEVANALGNKEGIYDYYLNQSRLERKTNNKDQAYDLIYEALQWRDSTLLSENIELMNEMTAKYESAKKEAQLALLLKENNIKTNERNLFLTVGISASLLLVLTIYLYFQKKKSSDHLQKKNQIINDALQEKEELMKEIHHRVKNNLQVVSSLLNIQSKLIKDPNAKKAVQTGRDRVHSMALTHKLLYQKQNISNLSLKEYIRQLSESLIETHGVNQKVKLRTEIDEVLINMDSAVNLGLLINELISNSMKHAFSDIKNAEISISLKERKDNIELIVLDNGKGINEEEEMPGSYGMRLIKSLAHALKGSIHINSSNGTEVRVIMPA